MCAFPKPLPPSQEVDEARIKRKDLIVSSLHLGIAIRILIASAEFLSVALFGSASLLLDALATGIDILTSLILLLCVQLAAKPPDKEHPYGHGTYEPLAGLQLGIFLIFVGGGMAIQQILYLSQPASEFPIHSKLWLVPLGATLLLEFTYRLLIRRAKKIHSPALAADAYHYRVDSLNSLLATIALGLGAVLPESSAWLDHLGAFFIAAMMILLGFKAGRENFNQLMDRTPEKSYFDKIRKTAVGVPGVLGTEKLLIRRSGPDAHVAIDVEVDPEMSVSAAHLISQKVRATIQEAWPEVLDVIVHLEPYYPDDHEVD